MSYELVCGRAALEHFGSHLEYNSDLRHTICGVKFSIAPGLNPGYMVQQGEARQTEYHEYAKNVFWRATRHTDSG